MDAFTMSLCKGFSMRKFHLKKAIIVGIYFGFFQAFMPFIGYFLGKKFGSFLAIIDHWIAFFLLLLIGVNMIQDAFLEEDDRVTDDISFFVMIPLAIATSIDALTVGILFSFLEVFILFSILLIGIITFFFSSLGVWIGYHFGMHYRMGATVLGGSLLILLGFKILLEHLGILF